MGTESVSISPFLMNMLADRYAFKMTNILGDAGGFSAKNIFLCCDGKDFILKCYRTHDEQKITRMENITRFLHNHGFPVPLSLQGQDGRGYFTFEGDFYSIFPRIHGQTRHEHNLTDQNLHHAGVCLASFHTLQPTDEFDGEGYASITEETITEESILTAIADHPLDQSMDVMTKDLLSLKRSIIDTFNKNPAADNTQRVLIHGDYHNENLLYGADDRVVGLLDFELVRIGDPLIDIMSFIHLACCNSGYKTENIQKARNFLDGYKTMHPLTASSLRSGMLNWMISRSQSFFIESKVYNEGQHGLAVLIVRDYNRLRFLSENVDWVLDGL